jgi:hypothetical protein
MKWLIIISVIALACGSTRRVILAHWEFFIFAVPAGILAWCMVPDSEIFRDYWWARWLLVLVAAIGTGASCKVRLDDILGRKK